jgi:nitronate monooxygenase
MNAKDFFGIERPIIQSPMAGVQDSSLTIAVSNAGGLGSLPCATLSKMQIIDELKTITQATSKPFNLNFFCHALPTPDAEREAQWLQTLRPFFLEYDLDINEKGTSFSRQPFNKDIIDIIEPFKPPVLSFHFGLPARNLVDRAKSWGALIIASATTVKEALWLQENGADAVIAQGLEAGGHRGLFLSPDITTQVGSLSLIPKIVSAVNIPVIAAGGFSDARSVAVGLSLGAIAVQLGTSFLLCHEAKTSKLHRAAIQSDASQHTAITNVFSGRPARSIVNRLVREVGPICANVPDFPLAASSVGALKQAAEAKNSSDFSSLWCGQNASGCKAISAAQLTIELTPENH